MKTILFTCVDNFGDEYKYTKMCNDDEVDKTIAEEKSLSTEIIDTEVLKATITESAKHSFVPTAVYMVAFRYDSESENESRHILCDTIETAKKLFQLWKVELLKKMDGIAISNIVTETESDMEFFAHTYDYEVTCSAEVVLTQIHNQYDIKIKVQKYGREWLVIPPTTEHLTNLEEWWYVSTHSEGKMYMNNADGYILFIENDGTQLLSII